MIRTRFAPSPTGYLHIGGLRTALYAYLFAKKNNGTFILRIEDTDQNRKVEGALENLIDTLKWAGLTYQEGPHKDGSQTGDHGPYIQSQRTEIYQEYVQKLIDNKTAYRCFCTKEELDEMREKQTARGQAPMYDRRCHKLPESEIKHNLEEGKPFVIRLKMPYEVIKFKDIVRGNVQFDGKKIDDQVLLKSDGFPTYHLANVVDDHLMEVTHVIRGEEWLSSTPKHIALYDAFGWEKPEFAHIPLLLNADRSKLSKRQGDVAVEDYMKKGYLKEAINNFIVFLGWNPGAGEKREVFTLDELAEIFTLEKVHKAGAVFNLEKLDWFNWRWQKHKHNAQLIEIAKKIEANAEVKENKKGQLNANFEKPENYEEFQKQRGELLAELAGEKVDNYLEKDSQKTLKALVASEEKILKDPKQADKLLEPYFTLKDYPKELLTREKMGVDLGQAQLSIKACIEALENLEKWQEKEIKMALIAKIKEINVKTGQVMWPMRAALSGEEFSSGAIEIAWALGKNETLNRLETAIKKLI
jgi:glutamyl-tRNA synthetase